MFWSGNEPWINNPLLAELGVIEIVLYLATGSIAGMLAGLLGVGGGLFIVPVLLFLLPVAGIESEQLMTICVATSLCTIVITSLSSVLAHHKHRAIIWPVFWRFVPGISLGALLGAIIADQVSQQLLKSLFGISVVLIAFKMLFHLQPKATSQVPGFTGLATSGTLIGCLSAMIGIGGGALIVPLLNYWKTPMAKAVATSATCGLPIAIAGTAGFIITGLDQTNLPLYSSGYVYWPAVFGIISTSVLFAPIGAKFAHKIPAKLLSQLFAIFLLIVGGKVLFASYNF